MIDIEIPVFNKVYEAVQAEYPGTRCLNDRPQSLAKFPCVVCVEDDNTTYQGGVVATSTEPFAEVMYTVDIFADNQTGGKTLCKGIASVVDKVFTDLRFSRMSLSTMPNQDPNILRYTGRYRAVVSAPIDKGTDEHNLPELEYYIYRR